MFRATTRRTKGDGSAAEPFQGLVIEADLLVSWVEPDEDPGYWTVAIPSLNGFAVSHIAAGRFETEAQAREITTRTMLRDGWRLTRDEAEADMRAEIERRANFRADGTPREKPAKSPIDYAKRRVEKRLAKRGINL